MITKCPHCGENLECGQPSGTLVDCASCGKPFEAYPASAGRAPAPAKIPPSMLASRNEAWRDNRAMLFVAVVGYGATAALSSPAYMPYAHICAAVTTMILFAWGCLCVRACAHRLKHIEELLARRP